MSVKVVIVGRSNVGKSTLFNRFAGRKSALVHDSLNVTRDTQSCCGWLDCQNREYVAHRSKVSSLNNDLCVLKNSKNLENEALIPISFSDTPGFDLLMNTSLCRGLDDALTRADVCFFIVNGNELITEIDYELARKIRKSEKKTLLIVNKCENKKHSNNYFHFFSLGFGECIPISALHGNNIEDILDWLCRQTPILKHNRRTTTDDYKHDTINKISIVGKTNVGKSTLLNNLIKKEIMLTGEERNLTRDVVEFQIKIPFFHKNIEISDTPGIAKKYRPNTVLSISTQNTMTSLAFAEIIFMVLDVTNPFEKQDLHILKEIYEEGRSLVVVVNKCDKIDNIVVKKKELKEEFQRLAPQWSATPTVFLSALIEKNVQKLYKHAYDVYENWNKRIETHALNMWLEGVCTLHKPPMLNKHSRIKFKYITQIKTRPPSFVIFTNIESKVPVSYERYIINSIKRDFKFFGTPVRVEFRTSRQKHQKEQFSRH